MKQPQLVAFDSFASVVIELIGTEEDDFSIKVSTKEAQLFIDTLQELLEISNYPKIPVAINFKDEKNITFDLTKKQTSRLVANLKKAIHGAVEAN